MMSEAMGISTWRHNLIRIIETYHSLKRRGLITSELRIQGHAKYMPLVQRINESFKGPFRYPSLDAEDYP
jgi:hypothetical protein